MLFNLFALGNTTIHIVKTRKVRLIACPSIRHFTLTADVVARSLANLQLHCFSSFHFTVSLLSISEKPTSNQSETGWQRSGYLYQNGVCSKAARVCIKMAFAAKQLGFAANLKALSFLWYPYVILNSLQGMFLILLVFGDLYQDLNKNPLLRDQLIVINILIRLET